LAAFVAASFAPFAGVAEAAFTAGFADFAGAALADAGLAAGFGAGFAAAFAAVAFPGAGFGLAAFAGDGLEVFGAGLGAGFF
jgi:hypothetical protein